MTYTACPHQRWAPAHVAGETVANICALCRDPLPPTDTVIELPHLGDGWDWLTITIPINRAHIDIEQTAHEAADAARAALDDHA